MVDPLTTAVVGSVTSQVAKEALNWLKSQGPEISEEEWAAVGYQIGNEILALRKQFDRTPTVLNEYTKEAKAAGKTYDELARVGGDFGFDSTCVNYYQELSECSNDLVIALEVNGEIAETSDEFQRTFEEYKSDALPKME